MELINFLERITGIDIYSLVSFTIFFIFFVVILIWALMADKKMINEISKLPLDD
jgi:cbb3-type cytochrome oxidase subunit 3